MEPRAITKAEAASYCGLTPTGYSAWVRAGRVPGPLPGTRRYCKIALERALDRLSGVEASAPALSPLERWKAKQAAQRGS